MTHILFTVILVSAIAYYMKLDKNSYLLAMVTIIPLMIIHKLYLGEIYLFMIINILALIIKWE